MTGIQLPPGIERLPNDVLTILVEAATDNLKHLQEMDEREMKLAERGQVLAFATSIIFGGLATWVTLAGHEEVGAIIGSTTVVSLAASFIVGRRTAKA